jgi:cytochrome c biogenesis protein CcmG/thiol:disulfide interchange protein DsbE
MAPAFSEFMMINTETPPTVTDHSPVEPRRGMPRIYAIPVLVFAVIAVAFAIGLTLNPGEIPTVLVGKPVPQFDLPPVQGRTLGLSDTDLKGEVSLVNVFASWCVECRVEHPLLMELSRSGTVPIHGLNYKDKPDDAQGWLDGLGDPYTRTGADINGRVAIDWGVYGVPETFIVDKAGRIAYKHIGAVNEKVLNEKIIPLVKELQHAAD